MPSTDQAQDKDAAEAAMNAPGPERQPGTGSAAAEGSAGTAGTEGPAAQAAGEGKPERPKRPRRPSVLRAALAVLGIALALAAVSLAAFAAFSALDGADPVAFVPGGFSAYASVPSASAFASGVLGQKSLDAILSGPGLGAARGAVRSLRAAPFLRSKAFARLADVRVDAALYQGGGFVAVARLGVRSAATRLAPTVARLLPGLLSRVKGLSYAEGGSPRFEYAAGSQTLYAAPRKDLLVIASSPELLDRALAAGGEAAPDEAESARRAALATALKKPGEGSLRFLADTAAFAGTAAASGPAAALLAGMEFPDLAVVDLDLRDDGMGVSIDLPASSKDEAVASLLERRSPTPSALARFPESAVYYSLLSAGKPEELWAAAGPLLGAQATKAWETADSAARTLLGKGLPELVFSWMGDELGVFGSSHGASPVFFAKIGDEKARRAAFDAILGSGLVDSDASALVDGVRVPRIVFPQFLAGFLESVGVRLPEPFYLVHDGFLYASMSAEVLAASVAESGSGRLLVKTEAWKKAARGVSPQSSASVYYSLDRSAPFFARGSSGLASALRLYGRGLASVRFAAGSIRLELSAEAVAGPSLALLPGFPQDSGGRVSSDVVACRGTSGAPMAFWTSGSSLVALNLASGERTSLAMDDSGWLAVEARDGKAAAVWAVSRRGTVYRGDDRLEQSAGFPVVTGQDVSGPPAVAPGVPGTAGRRLAVPVSDGPAVMFVAADGTLGYSSALNARLRSAPAASGWALAALPRSFESSLYLMDLTGATLAGWPVALSGLASAGAVFAGPDSSSGGMVAAVTEAGDLYAFGPDGAPRPGFPIMLSGGFDAAPAWAPGWSSFYLASEDGVLWRVSVGGADGAGSVAGSVSLKRGAAAKSAVTAFDPDGDGRESIYVSGGGDALYAYSGDLSPLPGFPVSGSGAPSFIDVDGDGALDLVVAGADDTIRAYGGR